MVDGIQAEKLGRSMSYQKDTVKDDSLTIEIICAVLDLAIPVFALQGQIRVRRRQRSPMSMHWCCADAASSDEGSAALIVSEQSSFWYALAHGMTFTAATPDGRHWILQEVSPRTSRVELSCSSLQI